MAHNEVRSSPEREAALALLTGSIYGSSHAISGHPLDCIKTRMQLLDGKQSAMNVAKDIYRIDGFKGFFKGLTPPLLGSAVYRGCMMSAYEFSYTYIEKNCSNDSILKTDIFLGLKLMIPISAIFAAQFRAIIEAPIEYAKIMKQVDRKIVFKDIYRGSAYQVLRTTALITPIFSCIDIARRNTSWLDTFIGNFLVTSAASGLSYLLCWPLETFKNLAQAGVPHPSSTIAEKIRHMNGFFGLYRGCIPGVASGSIRNGVAMIAMIYAQKLATKCGLRD